MEHHLSMKTIALHMPVFDRLKITRACYVGLKRNIKEFAALGYKLEVYVAGHEPKHRTMAAKFGWNWLEASNGNLGEKNQKLFVHMKQFDWDYLLQLGSDDFLLPGGAEAIVSYMEKGDEFACFTELYFFKISDGSGTLLKGYPCGAGRFMSRRICDGVKTMWVFASIGNDGRSADRIYRKWKIEPKKMKGAFIADIKSDVNVTPFFRHTDDEYWMKDHVPEFELLLP